MSVMRWISSRKMTATRGQGNERRESLVGNREFNEGYAMLTGNRVMWQCGTGNMKKENELHRKIRANIKEDVQSVWMAWKDGERVRKCEKEVEGERERETQKIRERERE